MLNIGAMFKFVNILHQGLSAASVKQEESPNVAEYNITGCEATHREFAKQGHSGEGTVLWQNHPSLFLPSQNG